MHIECTFICTNLYIYESVFDMHLSSLCLSNSLSCMCYSIHFLSSLNKQMQLYLELTLMWYNTIGQKKNRLETPFSLNSIFKLHFEIIFFSILHSCTHNIWRFGPDTILLVMTIMYIEAPPPTKVVIVPDASIQTAMDPMCLTMSQQSSPQMTNTKSNRLS